MNMSLKGLRQKRGLSQEQLAGRVGITRGRVADYESGYRPVENMTLGTAIKLCDALRVANPRKLLEPDEPAKENTAD